MSTSHDGGDSHFELTDDVLAAIESAETDEEIARLLRLTPRDLCRIGRWSEHMESEWFVRIQSALKRTHPVATEVWELLESLDLWTSVPDLAKSLYMVTLRILEAAPTLSVDAAFVATVERYLSSGVPDPTLYRRLLAGGRIPGMRAVTDHPPSHETVEAFSPARRTRK
jgi:hypothetical protein